MSTLDNVYYTSDYSKKYVGAQADDSFVVKEFRK